MTPREHYDRLGDLYRTLGEINGWHAPGNHDFVGWYRIRDGPGEWDGEGRTWALGKEWSGLKREVDRVVYATVNYAPARWFVDSWRPFNYGDTGKEWKDGEKPTPGYGDLRAYAPFADIDLIDDVKQKRPAGEIPRDAIEAALSEYVEAFAELAGDRRHVFALDSVGGAYVMLAPTTTTPIAEAFDRSDRARLFADLTDRMNEWLDGVRDDVNTHIQSVEGVFEPDLLNNKNRLYKAPLSVHSSLAGVVTPIDPGDIRYAYTALDDADGELIANAEAWAESFTAEHRDAVASVVAGLWADYSADADGWREALSARLDDLGAAEQRSRKRQAALPDLDDLPDDLETTDDIDTLNAAIEAIDVRDVARQVATAYDTAPGRDPVRFDPPWRDSDSGTSCFVDGDKFYDLDGGKGGGALRLIAYATPGIDPDLRGEDYWRAVNVLRRAGFDVPYYTGRDGTHPDGLRLFEDSDSDDGMKKVLRAVAASDRSRRRPS